MQNDQVLILAATNMPWDVDPAMKRPGRFARQVFVPPPDAVARGRIIELALDSVPHGTVDAAAIAQAHGTVSRARTSTRWWNAPRNTCSPNISRRGASARFPRTTWCARPSELVPTTKDWLRTARNLVKYAGGDDSYRDLERYLKANKLL